MQLKFNDKLFEAVNASHSVELLDDEDTERANRLAINLDAQYEVAELEALGQPTSLSILIDDKEIIFDNMALSSIRKMYYADGRISTNITFIEKV